MPPTHQSKTLAGVFFASPAPFCDRSPLRPSSRLSDEIHLSLAPLVCFAVGLLEAIHSQRPVSRSQAIAESPKMFDSSGDVPHLGVILISRAVVSSPEQSICKQPGRTRVFGSCGISPLNFFLDKSPAFYNEAFTTALTNLTRGDELQRARVLPSIINKPNPF